MSTPVPQANTRTNTLAATGERGDALALIGLIFGYFWLIVLPIGLVVAEVVST